MCHLIGTAAELSRRRLLQGAAGAAMAGATSGALGATVARGRERRPARESTARADRFRTRLVLLGVAGGPAWWGGEGIASAVVVDGHVYVVDCGEGAWQQYRHAGLGRPEPAMALNTLRAVFLTHLHSDHVVDYNNLLLFGAPATFGSGAGPIQIFGPGDRGSLPPLFGTGAEPQIVNPENPTPGVEDMTAYLLQAYAADLNDRLRDSRHPDLRTLVNVSDIPLPAETVANANGNPAPRMDPIDVFEDERVKVSATLVDHRPTFPSFAYRFETDDGSIVFSGDTTVSPNLIQLARDADILVHEVIDAAWVEGLFPPPYDPVEEALVNHLLGSHTTIEQVGIVAEEAQASSLVLNHLVPADGPRSRWERARRGFSGRLIVGEELMQVGVGRPRR